MHRRTPSALPSRSRRTARLLGRGLVGHLVVAALLATTAVVPAASAGAQTPAARTSATTVVPFDVGEADARPYALSTVGSYWWDYLLPNDDRNWKYYAPTMSDDGRFVTSNEIVTVGSTRMAWVYLVDTETGTKELVNRSARNPDRGPDYGFTLYNPNFRPSRALVSGDGGAVVFEAPAQQLAATPPDRFRTQGTWPYLYDTATKLLTALPDPGTEVQPSGGWFLHPEDITTDGRTVLLSHMTSMYLADLAADPPVTRALFPDSGRTFSQARLSGDGRFLLAVEPSGTLQWTRLFDLTTPEPTEIWQTSGVNAHQTFNRFPSIAIDQDGSTIAWVHNQSVPSSAVLYVLDRTTGEEVAVPTSVPEPAPGWTRGGLRGGIALSGDGSTLAFTLDRPSSDDDLFTHDRVTGRTRLVSWPASGGPLDPNDHGVTMLSKVGADLSADGRTVSFSTRDPRLVPAATSNTVIARALDLAPPEWPDGSAVRVTDVGSSFVSITWDAARDDTAVVAYRVLVDGVEVTRTGAGERSVVVDGLSEATRYRIEVIAVDTVDSQGPPLEVETTTVGLAPGAAALTARVSSDGTVALTWDGAGAGARYRVSRTIAGSTSVVAETSAVSHLDVGVPAQSTVTYRVDLVEGDGIRPHSLERSVTTPVLAAPTVTWDAPRLQRGELALGAELTVAVTGQPGRTARATLGADQAGGPVELDVELSETTAGRYVGSVAVHEGLTAVRRLTVALDDGAGHEATALGRSLPAPVSGAVRIDTVTNAPLDGHLFEMASGALRTASRTEPTGTGPVYLPTSPGTDHHLTVWRADGSRANTVSTIEVTAGVVTPMTLEVPHLANLEVTVVAPDGTPLSDVAVDVRAAGSTNATRATTNALGRATTSTGWVDGLVAEVETSSRTRPLLSQATSTVTLVPGTNRVTVEVTPTPAASVTGTVVSDEGVPIQRAAVRLVQQVSGVSYVRSATTGADGRFSVTAFVGSGVLSATAPNGTIGSLDVTLGPATPDVEIRTRPNLPDTIDLDLRVRGPGDADYGPRIVADWSTAIHLKLRVEGDATVDRGSWSQRSGWADGSTTIGGVPGTTVRVCADTREGGGGAGCSAPVALTATGARLPVDLRIDSPAGIAARLVGPAGAPLAGAWTARLSNGSISQRVTGSGPDLIVDLPTAGRYTVSVTSADSLRTGSTTLTVADGVRTVAPSAIVVGAAGAFRREGNSLVATSRTVQPGDVVELRVEYSASTPVAGARLAIELPAGWTGLDGATRDGAPVPVTSGDARPTVELGSVAALGTGTVRIPVLVPAEARPWDDTLVRAIVTGADATDHVVGALELEVVGLTLEGPETVAEHTAMLSGRAPAGAEVTITEGTVPVGLAVAGPGGLWHARVELPDRPLFWEHLLTARAAVDGELLTSEVLSVTYDPTLPTMEEIIVTQDGRTARFSPADGVARFPFVIVNGNLTVAVRFDRPGDVARTQVQVGGTVLDAVRGADGLFTARFPLRMGHEGPIWVDFTPGDPETIALDDPRWAAPDDADMAQAMDLVRSMLPPEVADFEVVSSTPLTIPAQGGVPTRTGTRITADVPSLAGGGSAPAQVRIDATASAEFAYTPSPDQIKAANAAGVPVFGAEITGTPASGTMTVLVPVSELTGGSARPAVDQVAGFGRSAPTVLGPALQMVKQVKLEWLWTGAQAIDQVNTGWESGSKYDKINGLQRTVNSLAHCPFDVAQFNEYIEHLRFMAYLIDAFNIGMGIVGLVAAPATLGGSLALFAVGWAADKLMGYLLDLKIEEAARDLAKIADECEEPQPRKKPQADPRYIYDPSGFVYEALTDNRLEGVTTTVLYAPTADGPWEVWDAEWFAQSNPLVTGADGRYAWDVPRGFWQVRYEKEGYVTATSDVLEVLPPHFDVNVGLMPVAAPGVDGVRADDAVEVTFTQLMDAGWIEPGTVQVTRDGAPVDGTVRPVAPADTPSGLAVSTTFVFVPDEPLTVGDELTVAVHPAVRNHADRPMSAAVSRVVTVSEVPRGPDEPQAPDVDGPGGQWPGADGPGDPGPGDAGPGEGSGTGPSAIADWLLPGSPGADGPAGGRARHADGSARPGHGAGVPPDATPRTAPWPGPGSGPVEDPPVTPDPPSVADPGGGDLAPAGGVLGLTLILTLVLVVAATTGLLWRRRWVARP